MSLPVTTDTYETINSSLLHHGPLNRRAYLVQLAPEDAEGMPRSLHRLARERGYTKLLARVPRTCRKPFAEAGFEVEARLPRYYQGREDCLYMARYLDPQRRQPRNPQRVEDVLAHANEAEETGSCGAAEVQPLGPEAATELAALYRAVFQAYPFPVFSPEYLKKCMDSGYRYCGVYKQGRLAAAACAEPDAPARAAELTDFATLPDFRRQGFAGALLQSMLQQARASGESTLFTICRAGSWGMNRAFAASGFLHAGTLWNNTHFDGRLEDMNIWTLHLQPATESF